MATGKDKRNSPLRRQANDAFCGPDGRLSITKTIAVFAQVAALYHFAVSFEKMIGSPETMAVILLFLVAPDTIKKFITMKYGVKP